MPAATVLFVHGTGVRRGTYITTYSVIQQAFAYYAIAHELDACIWGDGLGAKPIIHSLPDTTLSPKQSALTSDEELARWDVLWRDPLFELRLLKNRPSTGPRPPAALANVTALWERIKAYTLRDAALAIVDGAYMDACWADAWNWIVAGDDETAHLATTAATEIGEPAEAVARAIVAAMLGCAFEEDLPQLDGQRREALIGALITDWEARVAGKGTRLMQWFTETAAALATPIIKSRRGPLAESANPAAGDILRYQARPDPIRSHVRNAINDITGDVYVLAHSLGGIISVDLLATESLPRVKGLITVGSQAPYLHEIGALSGLEIGATELPTHFPTWLNIYDPYDFLSYVAEPLFTRGVKDCRIESGQPFPYSHSAYWTNPDTWAAIKSFLP
jgi:hypothetical protein